jgi:hypothetical protein
VLLDGYLLYYDKEGSMAFDQLDLHPNVSPRVLDGRF